MNDQLDYRLEELLNLADAAAMIPSPYRGKQTSPATVYRWIRERKLRGVRRNGMTFTTRRWIEAMFEPAGAESVESQEPRAKSQKPPALAERERVGKWSRGVLQKAGI